jgi:hypothetical protein
MNPNQLMFSKAMVTQTALRDEARESRRRRAKGGRPSAGRSDRGILGRLRRR